MTVREAGPTDEELDDALGLIGVAQRLIGMAAYKAIGLRQADDDLGEGIERLLKVEHHLHEAMSPERQATWKPSNGGFERRDPWDDVEDDDEFDDPSESFAPRVIEFAPKE